MKAKKILLLFAACIAIILLFGKGIYALEERSERITLDFKNAELASVLRSLSYSYDLNLVIAKGVKGIVNVSLRDVTIDEALGAILSVNGYAFTHKGNLIYVTPGPGLERIGMVTNTIFLSYLTASEASSLLENIVSSKGSIGVNEATNSLLITDYPDFIEKVKKILKEIDIAPIQVLIEAKLIDITDTDRLNWGTAISLDYAPNGEVSNIQSAAGSSSFGGPSTTLTGGQFSISRFNFKDITLSATIDALIQDNKAHLLASPSIATLSGKEARIIIGERFPYKERTQTTTGTLETTKFVDIGTTLRVTPQVSPDGWITMIVHPEVSSLAAELDDGPRITTREADATIRVRDGETIVIGGLIKRQETTTYGGVPILRNIPVLDLLFSNKSKDVTVTELVVFITPHIIRDTEDTKAIKSVRRDEVRVDIEGTGARLLATQLWNNAYDLEKGTGAIARSKDKEARMAEAFGLYKQIISQFPANEKADDAAYRAGKIAYSKFKYLELARKFFTKVVEDYPDSKYYARSAKMIKTINKKLMKESKTQ